MIETPKKDKLIAAVKEYALEFAPEGQPFILKSGASSMFYLDCRNLHLTPVGLHLVVCTLWQMMSSLKFDAFGGPCVGADPIIGGLTFFAGMAPSPQRYTGFMIRPESKDHGKGGRIVGPLKEDARCIIIEDVVTSGGSSIGAIEAVEDFGAKVVHVFSVVDRLQGGAERFAEKGIPYTPLLTINDLGIA